VFAKDLILHLIGKIGAAAGTGFAVEYAGSAIRAMPIEGRLTICNLSIELGAKFGMVTLDSNLMSLYERGLISYGDLITKAQDPTSVLAKMQEEQGTKKR
jgi:homoaconitase/3-isopropylmalate dehydratase large subunit